MRSIIITVLGIVTHFAGQNGEFWRAIKCYKKLMKREDATVVPCMSSQSKWRSHCNVCAAVVLHRRRNHAAIFKAQIMAEKTTTNL